MSKNTSFYLSGFFSIVIYFGICTFILFYIASPKPKTYNIKTKATAIQLEVLVKKSDKTRVERKSEKKIEKIEKKVIKETSRARIKTANVKSLFGKVKTTAVKTPEKVVENKIVTIDPKRFKAKYQKEKKTNNVKVDRILKDVVTTMKLQPVLNVNNEGIEDEYFSKINKMLSVWNSGVNNGQLTAKVLIEISGNGKFSYRIMNYSMDEEFNESLKNFLEEQISIIYPAPKSKRNIKINVEFGTKGKY